MTSQRRLVLLSGDKLTLYAIIDQGVCHADEWLRGLCDQAQAQFRARFERLTTVGYLRSPQEWRHLGSGVHEIKVRAGPGYRLYVVQQQRDWVATHGRKKPSDRKVPKEVSKARQIFNRYQNEGLDQ
jgi:putative component of toxin-antitoxin plasmid stabilization module